MSCCGKLGEALKKIFDALKPLLAVALLCVSAYFLFLAPAGATVGSVFGGLSWMPSVITTSTVSATTAGYLALGAAVIVDADGVSELAASAANTVGNIAGNVVAAAAAGASAALFGGNAWLWALGALALYFLVIGDKKEEGTSKDGSAPKADAPLARPEQETSLSLLSKDADNQEGEGTAYA